MALSLGIPTAYMAFFLGGPIVKAIGISFTNLALSGPQAAHAQFVGANNYSTLFTSSQFWEGLKASIEYLVGSAIIGQVVVGFILALFVERLGKLAEPAVFCGALRSCGHHQPSLAGAASRPSPASGGS